MVLLGWEKLENVLNLFWCTKKYFQIYTNPTQKSNTSPNREDSRLVYFLSTVHSQELEKFRVQYVMSSIYEVSQKQKQKK